MCNAHPFLCLQYNWRCCKVSSGLSRLWRRKGQAVQVCAFAVETEKQIGILLRIISRFCYDRQATALPHAGKERLPGLVHAEYADIGRRFVIAQVRNPQKGRKQEPADTRAGVVLDTA